MGVTMKCTIIILGNCIIISYLFVTDFVEPSDATQFSKIEDFPKMN
jgi:hypothetical protein